MGHKTCFYFPWQKKRKGKERRKKPHLPCQSRRPLRELCIIWRHLLCGRVEMCCTTRECGVKGEEGDGGGADEANGC